MLRGVIGQAGDVDVTRQALATVFREDIGLDLSRVALDVLAQPATAQKLNDSDLLALADRFGGRFAASVANLIVSACEHRKVTAEIVTNIAERWSTRTDHDSRLATFDLVDHVAVQAAQSILTTALRDVCSQVRSMATLRMSEFFAADAAERLLDAAIATETSRHVLADLLATKAEVLRSQPEGYDF